MGKWDEYAVVNDKWKEYEVGQQPHTKYPLEPSQTIAEKLFRTGVSGASGFNIGLANLAGMPIDYVNKFLSLMGLGSKEPIGGSESIKRIMPAPSKPEGFLETTAQATGEQIPGAMLSLAGGGGIPLMQKLMTASKFAAGAGLGSGVARTVAPDNPWADIAGQLAGGIGPQVAGGMLAKLREKIVSPIFGSRALTGVGTEVIERASGGTAAFRQGMRGRISDVDVYEEAQSALDRMLQIRRMEYKAQLPALENSTKIVDIQPLFKELSNSLTAFGVQFDAKGKIIRSTLDRSTLRDANQVIDMIIDWGSQTGDLTPKGLDMLKRNLDSFYSPNKNINAFVTPLRSKVKEMIIKEVPEYGPMMQKYEQWSELIRDVKQNLSMGEKSSVESAIRKLMSSVRDDNEFRRSLIQELEKSGHTDLLDKISGMQMKDILPTMHGGTQLAAGAIMSAIITGDPRLLLGLPLASPRLVGEFVNAIGRTVNAYRKVVPFSDVGQLAIPTGLQLGRPNLLTPRMSSE